MQTGRQLWFRKLVSFFPLTVENSYPVQLTTKSFPYLFLFHRHLHLVARRKWLSICRRSSPDLVWKFKIKFKLVFDFLHIWNYISTNDWHFEFDLSLTLCVIHNNKKTQKFEMFDISENLSKFCYCLNFHNLGKKYCWHWLQLILNFRPFY